jgi:cell division GTPase FtsZ
MAELLDSVDTMIVIPNEKLLVVAKDAGFFESFRIADDVLRQGVQGISDIITIPGIINRDFADVKTTMAGMGHAVMGTAVRSGENRAMWKQRRRPWLRPCLRRAPSTARAASSSTSPAPARSSFLR